MISTGTRRTPAQARGRRRVEQLLVAAGAVIQECGFEATTMSAIAARADTAIGSLYQFFRDKEALAEALRARYSEVQAPLWEELLAAAPALKPDALAQRLVRLMLTVAVQCPALPALLDAPRTAGSYRRRDLFRRRVALVLRSHQPRLSGADARRYSEVVQQLLRGLLSLSASHASDFEDLLAAYLAPRLREES